MSCGPGARSAARQWSFDPAWKESFRTRRCARPRSISARAFGRPSNKLFLARGIRRSLRAWRPLPKLRTMLESVRLGVRTSTFPVVAPAGTVVVIKYLDDGAQARQVLIAYPPLTLLAAARLRVCLSPSPRSGRGPE